MIEPGKILQQRYRIQKQIGQGGMGSVYVATDERFNSTVAIKETLCMDENFRKALEREARLLNSLKHAALPRVSDHFIEDNGQFLVMEFIPGDDLSVGLERAGEPFPFEKVQTWAGQLLDALDFLHNQSLPVIHRDIKPQNLKLTAGGHIVLLDFGLAKGNPTDAGFQTAAKSIFGYSRNYASLEQIQGTGTDPRSDLYSLAATLYHLATGHPPEDALTRAMAVLSNQPDPLVPANALNAAVPAGFAGVLRKALDLNAAARPASAREMSAMLRDMEAYSDIANDARAAATAPALDPHTQKTRLMPGKTEKGRHGQESVKTEVLPEYISAETALRVEGTRRGAEPTPDSNRRPLRRLAFSAAGLLLLLCGLAAGAYVINPSLFTHESPRSPEPEPALPVAEKSPPAIEQPMEVAGPDPEAADGSAAEARNLRPTTARTLGREPVKPAKPEPPADKRSVLSVGGEDDDLDGMTVFIGNTKAKPGKGNNSVRGLIFEHDINRPDAPTRLGIDIENLPEVRNLTPAQRRRLQRELRRKGLTPPKPQGPPQNKN